MNNKYVFITVTYTKYKAIVGGTKVEGCTLYTTLYPCNVCNTMSVILVMSVIFVIQSGITKVVYYKEVDPKKNKYKISKH